MAPSSSTDSRDSPDSPDPLTLPSSPLAARSHLRSSPIKPPAKRIPASPSKSFVMSAGPGIGEASPWRIKVTVEAEPQGVRPSPSRRAARRTEPIPLRDGEAEEEAGAGCSYAGAKKAVRRKRKATPVRRGTGKAGTTEREEVAMEPPPPAPTSSATNARRRRSLNPLPPSTRPPKRLSQAREELDRALQEAVGHTSDLSPPDNGDSHGLAVGSGHVPGDMTVALDEDFTMVSVETLQSMRGGVDTSLISLRNAGRDAEGEKSGFSVSYLPSSPPKQVEIAYPDLSDEVRAAEETPGTRYEDMSWKKTSAVAVAGTAVEDDMRSRRHHSMVGEQGYAAQPSAQQHAPPSQMIPAEDDTVAGAPHPTVPRTVDSAERPSDVQTQREEEEDDADIWQEEASRSLQEDDEDFAPTQPTVPQHRRRLQLQGDAATKPKSPDPPFVWPPRAKLPRTWRRTSGVDFSYSDSPEHAQPAPLSLGKRDASGSESNGGRSRASSGGVLTPPSSEDDEVVRQEDEDEAAEQPEDQESDVDFTRPDADATHLPPAHAEEEDEEVESPSSDSSASPEADGDDTGLFWQHNLPSIYPRQERPRPQRRGASKAMDLSELLALQKASSPAKADVASAGGEKANALNMRPVYGRIGKTANAATVVSSPLRRSLLRSSKVGGSPIGTMERRQEGEMVEEVVEEETVEESWASKASDQRQLLREEKAATPAPFRPRDNHHHVQDEQDGEFYDVEGDEDQEESYLDEDEEEEEETYEGDTSITVTHHDTTRSYEEQLNLDSPQKIRVKFNDSLTGNSSLLAPRKEYPPLFGTTSNIRQQPALSSQIPASQAIQPGVFTRLSTTLTNALYTALIRPSGPTSILPTPEPAFDPDLRAHIRSRYSVLPNRHPWTLTHMWTLNRMHNSVYTRACDSILPITGPLPTYLETLIGTTQSSVSGFRFGFKREYAYMVWSFMQILVHPSVIAQMERGDVEWLGDETSAKYRGIVPTASGGGRDGREVVFWESLRPKDGVEVEWGWVVKALGEVVRCEGELKERKERERVASA